MKRTALWLAILILFTTALLKLASMFKVSPDLLEHTDWLTGMKVGNLMVLSAMVELLAVIAILASESGIVCGILLIGLGSQFCLYHLMKVLHLAPGACPCLGYAAQWLGWSQSTGDAIAFACAVAVLSAGIIVCWPVRRHVTAYA